MTPAQTIAPLSDSKIGLSGFLAVHSTFLGPAFGGIRMVPYPDLERCKADAVRLAEAMTHKCAFHEIPGGGGKIPLLPKYVLHEDDEKLILRNYKNEHYIINKKAKPVSGKVDIKVETPGKNNGNGKKPKKSKKVEEIEVAEL